MATPVGRVEKEFLLNALFEEKIPVMYMKDRNEYSLFLEKKTTEEMVLQNKKPLGKLKLRSKLPLLFNYHGKIIDFHAEVTAQKENCIVCKTPDILYKNLDRNYMRVDTPSDLKILFTFCGERYNLLFPKISENKTFGVDELGQNMNSHNIADIVKQITLSLKDITNGFKIVSFKDKKPETTEELIVSRTGKTLFIPSTLRPLPETDPYQKGIITKEIYKQYLESTGVEETLIDSTIRHFMQRKKDDGFLSDAWVPIIFREYVIGYIHAWTDKEGCPPFNINLINTINQFTKALAFSLKENGYFEHGRIKNEPFEGRVLDISVSGLLFAYHPDSPLLSTLLLDAELIVTIEAPNRTINAAAKIVRKFNDKNACYFGCSFVNMAPEDTRFLFEYLYGRQIDSKDTEFLAGQV